MKQRKATRGRPGRIDNLPPELKALVDQGLRGHATQAGIRRETAPAFAAHGERPLSAGGLNRYASRMEAKGQRIREVREASDAWVARFGEAPSGSTGRYLVELLRTLAVDLTHMLDDMADGLEPEQAPACIDMLGRLALLNERIQRSEDVAVAVERKLREQLAEEAETVARTVGAPEDLAGALREALRRAP